MDSQNLFSAGLIMTMLLVSIGIAVLICFLVYNVYSSVPAEHQLLPPGQVWLLLIPLFNLFWNFMVYPKISESYKVYAAARGRDDGSDYGLALGRNYAICAVCSIIPCVGGLIGLVGLVFFIMWLVKMYDYKKQLAST